MRIDVATAHPSIKPRLNHLDAIFKEFPMLDMVRTQACPTDRRMPVDFTSYLLAASPPTPSTGFDLLSYAFNKSSPFSNDRLFDLNHNTNSNNNSNLNARRNGPLKSIIIKSDNESSESSEGSEESETSSTPISPVSPGRARKQVSFADHKGMALAQVRFLTEPSDMPPRLNPQLLVSLTQGATAGVTDDPPLKLCFTQPASDYLEFRERLEKECVSLENVILKNYSVAGTIKVKNISFEKNVFVRYSLDSWQTFVDVPAVYVPGPGESSDRKNTYDTFSFEFDVPTNFGLHEKVEFAVGYEANVSQYWDNNHGLNYQIVSSDYKEKSVQPSFEPSRTEVTPWTQYACWNEVDNSTPYW